MLLGGSVPQLQQKCKSSRNEGLRLSEETSATCFFRECASATKNIQQGGSGLPE